nr:hypothetical protein [Streptomyces graminilatus]
MLDLLRRTVAWTRLASSPGTGRRRVGAPLGSPPVAETRGPAHASEMRLPVHRSRYGLDHLLDGGANVMVRPYLAAYEQECARRQRPRLALVLAQDFRIDLERHSVCALKVEV